MRRFAQSRSMLSIGTLVAALLVGCTPRAAAPAPPANPAPAAPAAAPAAPAASAPAATSAGPAPAAAPAGEPRKLRVGVSQNVTIAPLAMAIEKGYIRDAGLELDLLPLTGGSEMVAPLSTGELDVAIGGISASLFNALARGIDAKIVSDFSRMSRGHGFGAYVGRNGVDLPNIEANRGKRVGFNNPGAPCHYMVGKMLESAGLTVADVQVVNMPFQTIPGAMAKQEIDAACAAEPWVANTIKAGDAHLVLTFDEIVPDMEVSVVLISSQLASERPVVERFLAALLKGAELGRQQTPEVMEVVSNYTKLDVGVLKDTIWTDMSRDGTVNEASMKDQLDFFRRAGLMQGQVDLDHFIDMSYLPRR
ncbi:MAG TPA: ABC transporter substrate-binding protein [Chloroflexota bacterium]|nr:ABC transporter substrate-binding protein [Chloroflexota bacterium]